MIACDAVAYSIVEGRGASRTIVHPLSFTADAGTLTLVRGPSGAGKSTLVSIVAGILRPTEGQVLFRGEPVSRYTAPHRDRFRRQVGLVPQRLHLFDELTALENVLLPLVPRRGDRAVAERALRLLDTLDLAHSQQVRTLSGGEQQRVAIVRSLVASPPLLVMDEPTAHQDDARVEIIVQLIHDALAAGAAAVMAAHDPRLENQSGAAQTIVLHDGKRVEA